jgi:hypothetical protein
MAGDASLIKIDSEAAKALIEKIGDAIGGLFRPFQIKRVARAEVEAEIIRAEGQIRRDELQRRAVARFVAEESKKQDNIENITRKAIPLLNASSTPREMENDWITNFFDKCRIISDDEMQILWSRVLAGEANSPGSFSKRTVNSLASLDKTDAEYFTSLCRFVWEVGDDLIPLIFDQTKRIYLQHGVGFVTLSHLDDIGLISFGTLEFTRRHLGMSFVARYYGSRLTMELKESGDSELGIGHVILTKTGSELARICGAEPVDGFLEYVIKQWEKEEIVLSLAVSREK